METPSRIGKAIAACDSELPKIGKRMLLGEVPVGKVATYKGWEFEVVEKTVVGGIPVSVRVRETITEDQGILDHSCMSMLVLVED